MFFLSFLLLVLYVMYIFFCYVQHTQTTKMERDPNLTKFNETRTDDNRMAGKINVEMGNKERKKKKEKLFYTF